jgi:hypothetical protein
MTDQKSDVWNEVIDFLLSRPTPEQIVDFGGSENFQERVRYLRDANQNGVLTPEEHREMDEIAEVGRFMRRVKIRALEILAETEKLPQS